MAAIQRLTGHRRRISFHEVLFRFKARVSSTRASSRWPLVDYHISVPSNSPLHASAKTAEHPLPLAKYSSHHEDTDTSYIAGKNNRQSSTVLSKYNKSRRGATENLSSPWVIFIGS